MTVEQLAEQYAEYYKTQEYRQDCVSIPSVAKRAYIAGYNEAKTKWHKVADGDLPPEDTKVLAFMAGGEVCIAHFYRKNVWDKIGIVIAWKEIVLPEGE